MESDQKPVSHPLTYVREELGWSTADLLDALATAGLSRAGRNKVHRWERRGVVPAPAAQRVLARALGVPEERLASDPWPRWLPAYAGVRELDGWSPGTALLALDDAVVGGPADRRAFLALSGPPLVELATGWRDAPLARLTTVIRGTLQVEEDTIGRIERHAAVLRTLDGRLPGDTLTAVAQAQLRLVAGLLTEGSFTARVARRLFLTVADLAHGAGWATFDTGQFFAAQRYHRAALHAAYAAGDHTLGAYLVVCLAYQAVRLGEPGDAPRLAEIAVEGAGAVPSHRARALLDGHLRVIRAATGGQPPDRSRHDPSPGPDDPAWARWFCPAAVSPFTARCYPLAGVGGEVRSGPWAAAQDSPPGGSHRQLHELAERMATAGLDALPDVRRALAGLLPPAA